MLQPNVFVDDTLPDQYLIGASTELPGAQFGTLQQFRRKHAPQTIELVGPVFILDGTVVVIAGAKVERAGLGGCGCAVPQRRGSSRLATHMVRQGHAIPHLTQTILAS